MAVKALQVRTPRGDVWHGPFGPALALALVVLPFAAALVWALSARPVADEREIPQAIVATADLVKDHAATMARLGERIAIASRASTVPERDRWTAYGDHLVGDAATLADLEMRLRGAAASAQDDLIHTAYIQVSAAILQARWEALRADGRATALHGRIMGEQARTMAAVPHTGIATDADLRELEAASNGMSVAGERTVRIADQLLSSVSQSQRWLGIWR